MKTTTSLYSRCPPSDIGSSVRHQACLSMQPRPGRNPAQRQLSYTIEPLLTPPWRGTGQVLMDPPSTSASCVSGPRLIDAQKATELCSRASHDADVNCTSISEASSCECRMLLVKLICPLRWPFASIFLEQHNHKAAHISTHTDPSPGRRYSHADGDNRSLDRVGHTSITEGESGQILEAQALVAQTSSSRQRPS
ncbi:hypothetical protein BD324DRAFT_68779 [Kockovaella imperatae]|uniref:Uncharacterized protein n=1 Tax=Kockovaella imperatae TaxID=4999 RepID=A0A1Y1UCE5_9TREE|nr:hypothetical protein BD324DRAFT_68779 [Kockovaella imperatae]ORX35672.1 hypothetical protein BD324DRAFT_68779 [Kockovaella imperatae]